MVNAPLFTTLYYCSERPIDKITPDKLEITERMFTLARQAVPGVALLGQTPEFDPIVRIGTDVPLVAIEVSYKRPYRNAPFTSAPLPDDACEWVNVEAGEYRGGSFHAVTLDDVRSLAQPAAFSRDFLDNLIEPSKRLADGPEGLLEFVGDIPKSHRPGLYLSLAARIERYFENGMARLSVDSEGMQQYADFVAYLREEARIRPPAPSFIQMQERLVALPVWTPLEERARVARQRKRRRTA
ncbi:MAG: hypothetical protein Q7S65_02600 [Nanoarchaeota archaeon]|nr:hypothetical protein [Nanoarchaeota archaeon]